MNREAKMSLDSAIRATGALQKRPGCSGSRQTVCGLYIFICLAALILPAPIQAHDPALQSAQVLDALGFDQRLNEAVPLDLVLQDEMGRPVRLGTYFVERPVILTLGYFACPNLCPLVRQGLLAGLQQIRFTAGREFEVVMVSLDPTETPAIATEVKQEYVQAYNRPTGATGWHFLTGDHAAIDQLANAIGFRYAYDTRQGQYAHASGIVILTPGGKIASYLFGIEYAQRDLRLALVDAAVGRIGSPLDKVLLFCYRYDPVTGQYTPQIMNLIRLAGMATVISLGLAIAILLRRERTWNARER
jgi:protein SCO1